MTRDARGRAMATKTNQGYFFEDYHVGQILTHATPRTLTEGDVAMYQALYGSRFALQSSSLFAASLDFPDPPLDDLIVFHTVFGKTVPDISLNAVANLGYAEGRFLERCSAHDTITAVSEIIGLKENSNGKTGIVWVRTRGLTNYETPVLEYVRWVMVRKRDASSAAPTAVVPELATSVAPKDLVVPLDMRKLRRYDYADAGEPHRWGDYAVGEIIDHVDGVTLTDPEHMMATRLWQNTAKVHFDVTARPDGKRLIYGGHIISHARALSFNGLANAQLIAAINAGAHANPAVAGDTIRAWSEVLDTAPTSRPDVGALRLRLVATKGPNPSRPGELRGEDGKYLPDVLLDLDYWALIPC